VEKNERQTYTVDEAAKIIGIARVSAYAAVHSGAIPTIKIGKRLLVPKTALERLLNGQDGSRASPIEARN